MSWFKKEVDDWDIVGRTIAPLPPSVDWDDEEDEEVELVLRPQTDANGLVTVADTSNLDLRTAELLKKLKSEAENMLKRKE